MAAPSEFPPPVDPQSEFVKRSLDAEDDLIEVGVAVVGGGTAGLAAANRLLQLLGDDPELLESLGEVPVAVIEKAKACGGHLMSGAVMRPEPLQELFPNLSREDRKTRQPFRLKWTYALKRRLLCGHFVLGFGLEQLCLARLLVS